MHACSRHGDAGKVGHSHLGINRQRATKCPHLSVASGDFELRRQRKLKIAEIVGEPARPDIKPSGRGIEWLWQHQRYELPAG